MFTRVTLKGVGPLRLEGEISSSGQDIKRKYRDTLPRDMYLRGIFQESDMYTIATFKGVCSL
jgi:hypothetical protein